MDLLTKRIVRELTDGLAKTHDGDWGGAKEALVGAIESLDLLLSGVPVQLPEVTTVLPIGYETAIGYIAHQVPVLFDLIEDVPKFVRDEEAKLFATCCASEGEHAAVSVKPPQLLIGLGVEQCLAFPKVVLRTHFGV